MPNIRGDKARQLKAAYEKVKKENESSRIRISKLEAENRSNKVQIKKLEIKSKRFAEKIKTTESENRQLKEKLKGLLTDVFLDQQENLREIETCRPYETFFDKSVFSLQILIGFAAVADTLTQEEREYYMWDVIAAPLIQTVGNHNGKIQNGILMLPEQTGGFVREDGKAKIKEEEWTEIERYIREDRLQAEQGKIALQKKKSVRALGSIIEEIKEMDRSLPVNGQQAERLARKVQGILEENGIYPMFAEDVRLSGNRELKERFGNGGAHSISYPGLFIRLRDRWEVLGSNIGMDRNAG